MPVVENVIITKNSRLAGSARKAAATSRPCPALALARRPRRLRRRLEQRRGLRQRTSAATTSPITDAARNAPCQPSHCCRISMLAGVTAVPRKPAKMCIENAWPRARSRRVATGSRSRPGDRPRCDAEQREHRDHQPERRDRTDDHKARGADQKPGDQHQPRTDAVHQKTRRGLAQRGRDVEHRQREAELRIAHAVEFADERKQRRQHQDVEMADEMRRADERNDASVVVRVAPPDASEICVMPGWLGVSVPTISRFGRSRAPYRGPAGAAHPRSGAATMRKCMRAGACSPG